MKQGVFDVIPRGSLDGLTSEDLRLLLNGMGDINTQSLISYTSFNDETGDSQSSHASLPQLVMLSSHCRTLRVKYRINIVQEYLSYKTKHNIFPLI